MTGKGIRSAQGRIFFVATGHKSAGYKINRVVALHRSSGKSTFAASSGNVEFVYGNTELLLFHLAAG